MFPKWSISMAAMMVCGLGFAGCSQSSPKPDAGARLQVRSEGHTHEGWWCGEHGVPEEVCAQCNLKLVAEFKSNGDWCKEHDRPDSQCFICHPERAAGFAAQYEAKYGKQPPDPAQEAVLRSNDRSRS